MAYFSKETVWFPLAVMNIFFGLKKVFWVGTPKTLNARNVFFFTKVKENLS